MAIAKLKKNSVPAQLTAQITASDTTIPVTELSRFYDDDGVLITKGIIIGGDNANAIIPEEITITGASAVSGAGNLTGATRGYKADGSIGAAAIWTSGTNIAATFTTGVYDELVAGNIPTINLTGGQIAFPSAQAASADANTLDDYEEGTFDPSPGIAFGGGTTGITYNASATLGSYTKIGNMVFFRLTVTLTSKGSSVGSAYVTGLPFSMSATIGTVVATTLTNVTFADQIQAFISTATPTTVTLGEVTNAGSYTALTNADFANNSVIRISGVYRI